MRRSIGVNTNASGALLGYLKVLQETDVNRRRQLFERWVVEQCASTAGPISLDPNAAPTLDDLLNIFASLGWMTAGFIEPRLVEACENLVAAKMIRVVREASAVQAQRLALTAFGKDVFERDLYNNYFVSQPARAQYWKDSNVKIYRNHVGCASGFFVSPDAIVTCRHVLAGLLKGVGFDAIVVRDEAGTEHSIVAVEYHRDEYVDLALVRVAASCVRPLHLGPEPYPVEPVVIFGYPEVVGFSDRILLANAGEVSAVTNCYYGERGGRGKLHVLVLSSMLKRGNSGGPVLDSLGRVVGVVTANPENMIDATQLTDNMGFDLNGALSMTVAVSVRHISELLT